MNLEAYLGRASDIVLSVVAVLILVACHQPTPPPEVIAANPRAAEVELPQAVLPDGATITLELAQTGEEIERGLMFRPSLPANRGMLFLFTEDRFPTFWMMNTFVALDLLYLDKDGVIVDMTINAQPCSAEPCPRFASEEPCRAVLELVAGSATEHGLSAGGRIEFDRVPGYPVAGEESEPLP
jgi:uncharacterized membrane protein (UPF0127 family)